ncbi:thiamine-phosphate pyrophosphorylase [Nitrosophilus alvini]|uniref:thiamine-phosphate pyrophosphorylase n=1 Tax=Nitrosophilus alvini TaxID=2714855 RepID=UPI001F439867|nr:thiamine-phosphate pyrophosphorylase [Nitrosophilus alvini]
MAHFEPKLSRLIDANLNRLKEGIRVIEDIYRYIYDDKSISSKLKYLRHLCNLPFYEKLIEQRDIKEDVLKQTIKSEEKREDIKALIIANFKRAQESSRVLEESLKLIDTESAEKFKKIRYDLYDIEKEALSKIK